MPHIASALCLTAGASAGDDLELADVEDFDGLIELLREEAGSAASLVAAIEEDDEYVLLVRLQGDADARVFISDARALEGDGLAGRLIGDELAAAPVDDEEDDEESARPEVVPAGDPALLADLGVDGDTLLALCAREGQLPADVIFEVCERIGCAEVLEDLRGV